MTRTWTDTLATFDPIGPEEREELEAQAKVVATNAAGAFAGTKRSFAMLATHLGAELEQAKRLVLYWVERHDEAARERDRLRKRVDVLEAAMNPQEVSDVDAALEARP